MQMEEKMKRILYGVGTGIIVGASVFLAYNKIQTEKKSVKKSKERANNAYYDTLTEADIAWG